MQVKKKRALFEVALDQKYIVKVDGEAIDAYEGESVASLLFRIGRRVLSRSWLRGEPRGVFCGMGFCHDCLVSINGLRNVRACMTGVESGMEIETSVDEGLGEACD